ncbi:MAG: phage virion morphogenesis protein [Fibromonadaceae bacterium]|jgi:phage gpG-like protein|nr:phage virion morphogenesis protein [Fibromonadaceae bacterium]
MIVNFFADVTRNYIKEMQKRARDKRICLNRIGQLVVTSVRLNFTKGGRPEPWKPSSGKKTLVGLGTRGGLMGSIHYKVNGNTVEIATNKPYAAIHQFGGTIKAKNAEYLKFKVKGKWVSKKEVIIPKREYMVIQEADHTRINELLAKYITEGK